MASMVFAKLKKTLSPAAKATASETPVAEGDELVHPAPAYDDVARLAYTYWLDRKDTGEGSPDQDWLRAEEELRGDRSAS
jgi:hypothetical protein